MSLSIVCIPNDDKQKLFLIVSSINKGTVARYNSNPKKNRYMKKRNKFKKLLYSPQYLIALILFSCAIFFYLAAEEQRLEIAAKKEIAGEQEK